MSSIPWRLIIICFVIFCMIKAVLFVVRTARDRSALRAVIYAVFMVPVLIAGMTVAVGWIAYRGSNASTTHHQVHVGPIPSVRVSTSPTTKKTSSRSKKPGKKTTPGKNEANEKLEMPPRAAEIPVAAELAKQEAAAPADVPTMPAAAESPATPANPKIVATAEADDSEPFWLVPSEEPVIPMRDEAATVVAEVAQPPAASAEAIAPIPALMPHTEVQELPRRPARVRLPDLQVALDVVRQMVSTIDEVAKREQATQQAKAVSRPAPEQVVLVSESTELSLATEGPSSAAAAEPLANVETKARPEWVDAKGALVGSVYRTTVCSELRADARDCQKYLDDAIVQEVHSYIKAWRGSDAANLVYLPMIWLRKNIVKDQYQEVVIASVGPMQQVYALLEFDDAARAEFERRWHDAIVEQRLHTTGVTSAALLAGLGVVYGTLRLRLTRRNRKQLAAAQQVA